MDVKVCSNCKYFKPDYTWASSSNRIKFGKCTHPKMANIDIVSGKIEYIEAERARRPYSACKYEAILYEPETDEFKKLKKKVSIYFNIGDFILALVCLFMILVVIATRR